MKPGVIPYGYAYLEGALVVAPHEYKVVLLVVKLWKSGKSFKAIARLLNDRKTPTRLGGSWYGPTVAAIVRRETETQTTTNR